MSAFTLHEFLFKQFELNTLKLSSLWQVPTLKDEEQDPVGLPKEANTAPLMTCDPGQVRDRVDPMGAEPHAAVVQEA